MARTCPECGASWWEVNTCQSVFDSFLVLEFTDPAYGVVHFLTVACFMIQHGRYSDEALQWIQETLRAYFDENLTPTQLRQRAVEGTRSDTRKWNIRRASDAPHPTRVMWSMTIMDVARQYHDAPSYCHLVQKWARLTLQEMTSQP
jgi:hypothetical protein